MAEQIEMQFRIMSGVCPRHTYYMDVYAPMGRGTLGVSSRLKSMGY